MPEPRRLVLLLDGTWNKRSDTTNVWRTRMMLREDRDQVIYYDEGVGTTKGEVFAGGALATGLSAKVLNAYLWLMENYEGTEDAGGGEPDEVFIFGFSRGAFTARSLVGVLAISGLLRRDAPKRVLDAFELSRVPSITEWSGLAIDFRRRFSRTIKIKFLGVWDTVGSLGVPRIKGLPELVLWPLETAAWHKVRELPSIVTNARHAMAIDEHRFIFDTESTIWPSTPPEGTMEQRWFIGAHMNVGGGYGDDGLFRRPLQWLQAESKAVGLKYRANVESLGSYFYASAPRDPLDEVAYGLYNLTQWFRPHFRTVTLGDQSNQTMDYSVLERWLWNPWYRPRALADILPAKPRGRPKTAILSDAEIFDLLGHDSLCVSASRGFSVRSWG